MNGSGVLAQTAEVSAQAAADNTGRNVMLLIIGLLLVAALLAALTVWYWRHTDPRRRRLRIPVTEVIGKEAAARTSPPTATVPEALAGRRPDPKVAEGAFSGGLPSGGPPSDRELLSEGDDADEWVRLTSPRAGRAIR